MMIIRPEKSSYYSEIRSLNELAFDGTTEAGLIEALRKSDNFIPELSLVAVQNGKIIGHILFTPVVIKTRTGDIPALSLAPMAVLPEKQNRGVGSKLVTQGLEECRRLGHTIIVVIGHPTYYPRFGFRPARESGLEVSFPVPDEAFMVLELEPHVLPVEQGEVVFPPEFQEAM